MGFSCATLVAHADWSVDPRKRWVTTVARTNRGWALTAPRLVGNVSVFLFDLIGQAQGGAVALGADVPIGIPRAYAASRPEADFPSFLRNLATLPDFFSVCTVLDDLRLTRPFYPTRGIAGMTRLSHALALGFPNASALSRLCDRATTERPAGAPLFWTLGANQVGKAAIAAWRDLIIPSLASKTPVRLWPFQGPLQALLSPGTVALAETYPAEALHHLGIRMGGSKRRQADRRALAEPLMTAMDQLSATPDDSLSQALLDGFGPDAAGEDRFDTVLGVLCLLNVISGRRPDFVPADPWIHKWEGWILGQTALPTAYTA